MLIPRNRQHMAEILGLKDKICIEVGTRNGNYAAYLLQQDPKELHLVDIWTEQDPKVYIDKRMTKMPEWQNMYEKVVERFRNTPQVMIHRMYSGAAAIQFLL